MKMVQKRAVSIAVAFGVIVSCVFSGSFTSSVSADSEQPAALTPTAAFQKTDSADSSTSAEDSEDSSTPAEDSEDSLTPTADSENALLAEADEKGGLTTEKTAHVVAWDDRTYQLTLTVTAKSKIVTSGAPCDVILVLDRSGSMENDYYAPVQGDPDESQTYYIYRNGNYRELSHDADGWYYTRGWGSNPQKIHVTSKIGGMGDLAFVAVKPGSISTSETYYAKINGIYQEVQYFDHERLRTGLMSYEYLTGWCYISGTDLFGDEWAVLDANKTPSETFYKLMEGYQFYIRTGTTKLEALKNAAEKFVADIQQNSQESRVDVISFSYRAYNETNGLLPLSDANVKKINDKINALRADDGTHPDLGMEEAMRIFAADQQTGRNRVVVMFTDGQPGDYGFSENSGYRTAASTINEAAILKFDRGKHTTSNITFEGHRGTSVSGSGCGASVYTVGLFSGDDMEYLSEINDYMGAVASSSNQYLTVSDTNSLSSIFQQISEEVGNVSGATVTDVIDSRFELTDEAREALKAEADVTENASNGTTTIQWKNQEIDVPQDEETPSWERTFEVKAKDGYRGGNNVPTNDSGSGVKYGTDQFVPFPQPCVNVRAIPLQAGDASATIFRGESVPTEQAESCKIWGDDQTVNFQWYQQDGKTPLAEKNGDFPSGLTPDTTTSYLLKAAYDCGQPSEQSTDNSDGNTAGVKNENGDYLLTAIGTYTVEVLAGEIDLTKVMDQQYPVYDPNDGTPVNPQQSFVFRITRSETLNGSIVDTFYEVITPAAGTDGTSRKITGLKKGYYTVTEESGAWRYTQKSLIDNDDRYDSGSTGDGVVYLGNLVGGSYFGAETTSPAKVTFTGTLTRRQWFGDTTAGKSTISHQMPATAQ